MCFSVSLSSQLYRMPYYGLQLFRGDFPCVTQIYFMVQTLIRDIQIIALRFHVFMHYLNSSRLIIIGPYMHAVSFSEIESPSLLVRRGSLSLLRGRKSNLVRIQQARHPSRRIRWWRSASQGTVILVS